MNTSAPLAAPTPKSRDSGRWQLALLVPAVVIPFWCLLFDHSGTFSGSTLGTATGSVLILLLAVSSVTDIHQRKIFNWTTYTALAWALAINAAPLLVGSVDQLGAIGLRQSLFGFAVCFAVMMLAYSLARGGAGDVKLVAAIGALIGVQHGLLAIAVSYILAGSAVIAWSIWTQGPWTLVVAMGRLFGSLLLPMWIEPPTRSDKALLNKPIPLAGFFAAGTLIVVLELI